ncbi:Amino acid transporter AVT6A [Linum perenne]
MKEKNTSSNSSPLLLPLPHEEESSPSCSSSNREVRASFIGSVFNLSTTIIGAGIMALPATMKVLGLGLGIGLIIFVAALTERSLEMLLRYSKAGKVKSYGGVMGDAFGGSGKIMLQICVLLNNVGVLVVYMIIIGDVLSGTSASGIHQSGVLEEWFGTQWWNGRTSVFLFMTAAVFAPLACLKHIDSLKFSSAIAVALAAVFLFITAGIVAVKLVNGTLSMPRLLPDVTGITSFWNLFTTVPVLVTAFICHFNVHTIENELEDPSQIRKVVQASLALCSSAYIMISLFGFLLFGDSTLDDVLANFNTDLGGGIPYSSVINDIVRVSYALHLMLVFPVLFYPLRLSIDGLLFPSATMPLSLDSRRFALITIALICLIFLGADFVPSIWDAFQFTGATSAVCLGFIFPAAIALRDRHGIAAKKEKILSVFMIFLAVLSCLVAIYSDAYALLRKKPSHQHRQGLSFSVLPIH